MFLTLYYVFWVFVFPLILLRTLLVKYYGFGLRKLVSTYLRHSKAMRVQFVLVFLTFVLLPLFLLPIGGIMESIYHAIARDTVKLAFLGCDQNSSYWLNLNEDKNQVMTGTCEEFATNVLSLYQTGVFLLPKGEANIIGSAVHVLSPSYFVGSVFLAIAGILLFLLVGMAYAGVAHRFIYQTHNQDPFGDPFYQWLASMRITKAHYFGIMILAFLTGLLVSIVTPAPKSKFSEKFGSYEFHVGDRFEALITHIDSGFASSTTYDGHRNARVHSNLIIDHKVPYPIHLEILMNIHVHSELYQALLSASKKGIRVPVLVNENYQWQYVDFSKKDVIHE